MNEEMNCMLKIVVYFVYTHMDSKNNEHKLYCCLHYKFTLKIVSQHFLKMVHFFFSKPYEFNINTKNTFVVKELGISVFLPWSLLSQTLQSESKISI